MEGYDYDSIINVIGKYGCNQTTLCTLIEHDVKEKISPAFKFNFEIFFETQLAAKRNELVIEDPEFSEYKESPIIFLTVTFIINKHILFLFLLKLFNKSLESSEQSQKNYYRLL